MKVFMSFVIGVAVLAGISAFAGTTQSTAKACVEAGKGPKAVPCDPAKQSCPKAPDANSGDAAVVQ